MNQPITPEQFFFKEKEPKPFTIHTESFQIYSHEIYISEAFIDPIYYTDLLELLRGADEHDQFTIYLNTSGGRLDSGLQMIHAIQDTKGRVRTVLDPQAWSMGALVFLAGHELVIPDHSTMMFHNYSSGLTGKGNEQLAEVQAANRTFKKVLEGICHPFLSQEEIRKILNGQDLWLDSDEIRKRATRMVKKEDKPKKA